MIWLQIYTFPLKAKNNSPTKIIIRTNNLFRTTDLTDSTDLSDFLRPFGSKRLLRRRALPRQRHSHHFTFSISNVAVKVVPSSFSRRAVQFILPAAMVISHHSRFSTPLSIQRVQSRVPSTKYSFSVLVA